MIERGRMAVLNRADAQDLADYRQAAEVLRAIVKEKEADNARLRAALTAVADSNDNHWEFRNGAVVSKWRLIARDALNQEPASSSSPTVTPETKL